MSVLTGKQATLNVDPRHWRFIRHRLRADLSAPDFATAARFVAALAALADEQNHHPDVVLRYGQVTVTTTSHDAGGLTARDVDLAGALSALADDPGLTATAPLPTGEVEIAIDALDIPAVRPFWAAVLGYDEDGDDALVDPAGVGPNLWFQQMDAPRPQRNRIHLDVSVGHGEALGRVTAALAAGGRLLSDEQAPAFWVLADPEGNEACVCTWRGRQDDDRDADRRQPEVVQP